MFASGKNIHQDVIRIIGSSKNSFDDAVADGIASLNHGHSDLEFY